MPTPLGTSSLITLSLVSSVWAWEHAMRHPLMNVVDSTRFPLLLL